MTNHYIELAKVDVNQYKEKKGRFDYLSWAWAVDILMRHDPAASWKFHEPVTFGETMMVSCTVTAFNKPIYMHLPVMDHHNKAIKNPDARDVNDAMMRCLVKGIACHGLGLYIYAGEDLPQISKEPISHEQIAAIRDLSEMKGITEKLICTKAKINTLNELTTDRLEGLLKWLQAQ